MGTRRRRQWWWASIMVLGLFWIFEARGDEDRIIHHYNIRSEPSNPLWRQTYVDTGERRGPSSSNSSSSVPPRLLQPWRQRPTGHTPPPHKERPKPTPAIARFETLQGGQQQQLGALRRLDLNDPTAMQVFGRWMQHQRSKRGTITVDFVHPDDDDEHDEPKTQETAGKEPSQSPTNTTASAEKSANVTTTTTTSNAMATTRTTTSLSRVPRQLLRYSETPASTSYQPNVEVSVSINPSSLFRLTYNLVKSSAAFLGAFGATLRLLAPMIVARRLVWTVGSVCYDYYYGRYIRTTYNKQYRMMQQYEIPSVLRAGGRMGLQLITMVLVGTLARILLHQSPCFLPAVACRYWYGSVWVISVLLASQSIHFWMQKYPALRLQMVTADPTQQFFSPADFFTRPWHILQWMKDPETWLLNLTRLQSHPPKNHFLRARRDLPPFRPDPLLFPSTWPPLHVLSFAAIVHAIAQTLPIKTGANTRILMQDFCLAVTVLDEWKRVFLYEHRITLGVVWSALSFAVFFVLAFSTALEVGWISAALLLPMVFACLVSGWMNTVLYSERYVRKLKV